MTNMTETSKQTTNPGQKETPLPIRKQIGKAAQNKQRKRDALFNTAFDLFSKQGIQNTTISNIVEKAGVGKGTFYLYFKDKYDIRNRLIAHKASQIFLKAADSLESRAGQNTSLSLEDKVIIIADDIMGQFEENPQLLRFISKELVWGVFKSHLALSADTDDLDFYAIIHSLLEQSDVKYSDPEAMFFMIIEMVGSASYNSILHGDPLPIEKLKPYVFRSIRAIMHTFEQE